MDELDYTVTVTITGKYPHGEDQEHVQVRIAGDGSPEHMLDAFRAILHALGHSKTAAKLPKVGVV